MDGAKHLVGIFPAAHQDDALDAPDLFVQPEDTGARCGADRYPAEVLQQHRHTVLGLQCDLLDVGHGLNQADAAHDHGLLAIADQRAPGVPVVHLDRLRHVRDRQPVFLQRQRVDRDLILLDHAAKDDDLGHAFNLRQPRRNDPVLKLAQGHVVVALRLDARSDRTR